MYENNLKIEDTDEHIALLYSFSILTEYKNILMYDFEMDKTIEEHHLYDGLRLCMLTI